MSEMRKIPEDLKEAIKLAYELEDKTIYDLLKKVCDNNFDDCLIYPHLRENLSDSEIKEREKYISKILEKIDEFDDDYIFGYDKKDLKSKEYLNELCTYDLSEIYYKVRIGNRKVILI